MGRPTRNGPSAPRAAAADGPTAGAHPFVGAWHGPLRCGDSFGPAGSLAEEIAALKHVTRANQAAVAALAAGEGTVAHTLALFARPWASVEAPRESTPRRDMS